MKQGSLRSSAYAVLTALIWGTAFVAQSVGAEHVPPLAFNTARSVIAFVFLLVLCAVMRSGRRGRGRLPPSPAPGRICCWAASGAA